MEPVGFHVERCGVVVIEGPFQLGPVAEAPEDAPHLGGVGRVTQQGVHEPLALNPVGDVGLV